MRKETKKQLIVFIIIFLFFGSSFAFIAINVFINPQPETDQQYLDNFVIDGRLNQSIKSFYFQNGYTVMEFYYENDIDPALMAFINQIPDLFVVQGQKQVIVQKIHESYEGNTTYIIISSINAEKEFADITQNSLFNALCEVVLYPPIDCGLAQVLNQTNTTD